MYGEDIIYDKNAEGDYPSGKLRGAISITKVRNAMKKAGFEVVKGSNIRVNHVLRGSSGFIQDTNGHLIYFDTEPLAFAPCGQVLYRSAKDLKDYCGGSNNYVPFDYMGEAVGKLFKAYNPSHWGTNWS